MEPAFVKAKTLDNAYFQLISKCWDHGYKYKITEGSFKGGNRLELCMAAGWIEYPHTMPLSPIMPEGIQPPTTDEKIEDYFTNYLMDPNLEPNEEYRYSTWINGWFLNKYISSEGSWESQLDWCIRHFKEKGFGNAHCYITVGDPSINFNYDAPYKDETDRRTSPCLRGIDIKVKYGKVILKVDYRSWDLYSGFPGNMGGFALLNQYIANQLEIDPGPLAFSSAGLHCYDYQIKSIAAYLRKEN